MKNNFFKTNTSGKSSIILQHCKSNIWFKRRQQILISTAVFHVILVEMCLGNLASHRDIVGKNGGLTNSLSHKCGFFSFDTIPKMSCNMESETLSTFGIFYLKLVYSEWIFIHAWLEHCALLIYKILILWIMQFFKMLVTFN